MDRKDAFASLLADEIIATAMVPWACPADFGPDGRYRLQELVGTGRHSLVYRAHDRLMSSEGFQATVAIKIKRGAAVSEEALTARRVLHENVLRVTERGVDPGSGTHYLVMEYVGGGDLSSVAVPMETRQAVRLMAKVARGVQAAHSAGVVHCDLKPANILLTSEGEPKVSDFDLAASEVNRSTDPRGNMAFMSPEQFISDVNALTAPSDVYALGGLLLYLVTGTLPDRALGGNQESPTADRTKMRSVSGDLGRIIARATAKDRDQRHHSAGEFADDLIRWLALEPIPWVRTNPLRRLLMWTRRKPFLAAGTALALSVLVGGVWLKFYLEAKGLERDRQAQADAKRLFEDERKAAGDDVVRFATQSYAMNVTKAGSDRSDRVLPMLVLLEMLGGTPVLDESHRIALASERITQLRGELAWLKEHGRGNNLNALIMRYGLAYFLVSENRGEEALEIIPEIEQLLLPKLPAEDPVRTAVQAVKLCAEALTHPVDQLERDVKALKALGSELHKAKDNESVRRLIQRVVVRLDQRLKAGV